MALVVVNSHDVKSSITPVPNNLPLHYITSHCKKLSPNITITEKRLSNFVYIQYSIHVIVEQKQNTILAGLYRTIEYYVYSRKLCGEKSKETQKCEYR